MLSTALGFPKGKRATDNYPILAVEAADFSQGLENTKQVAKLSFISS